MKKLNQILEFSNKSSLKFKLEQEVSPHPNYEFERNNFDFFESEFVGSIMDNNSALFCS